MSKVEMNQITVVSTGNETPVLDDFSLVVQRVVMWVSDASGGQGAAGYYDSSVTFTGSSTYKDENMTKTLTHYRNVSGVKTKVFEAVVTSIGTGQFTFNVSTWTASTSVKFVVFGV